MATRLELNYRYDRYIKSFAEGNLISFKGEEVDRPTKRTIQDDEFNIDIRNTSVDGSHQLLLTNDSRRSGIRYLSPDQLSWLAVKLTEVLQVNVCEDHEEFWWFTHDFARAFSEKYGLFPVGLIDNLELLIRLVLSIPVGGITPVMRRVNEILYESKTLASYLSYPTLEGFVKVACRYDIKINGEIRKGRRIRELTPPDERKFKTAEDGICSNLGMLLWHLETEVSRPQNQILMEKMREATGEIFDHPSNRIYGLFNDFRNNSLHGRERAPREYGVILNYICLVIWITLN